MFQGHQPLVFQTKGEGSLTMNVPFGPVDMYSINCWHNFSLLCSAVINSTLGFQV